VEVRRDREERGREGGSEEARDGGRENCICGLCACKSEVCVSGRACITA
jgi:hypothetical protein